MASAVVSDNFETGSGGVPQLGGTGATTCKAWVNFNGTGTVSIRDSFNVASITDNGTGRYYINFTNAMPNINYTSIVAGYGDGTGQGAWCTSSTANKNTTGTDTRYFANAGSAQDQTQASCNIFSN